MGEPAITTPSDRPTFDANVTTGLVITNTGGTIAIKLACSGSSDAFNLVSACAPQNSGTRRPVRMNFLGELPAIANGFAPITSLYTAKFGVPAVGDRLFVQSQQMENGWKDIPKAYTALVPTSS